MRSPEPFVAVDAPAMALGPYRVTVDADKVAAFARETGFAALLAGRVPLAFPATWLAAPAIRAAVAQACAEADSVPFHEQQKFGYAAPLRIGEPYDLAVTMRRQDAPARLALEARVTTPDGDEVVQIETLMRLAPRSLLKESDA
jgi:hypothetical protein